MSKKGFGKFIALATVAGAAVAGISYLKKYQSFNKELDEEFHDFEDDEEAPIPDSTMTRNYVSLSANKDELLVAAGGMLDAAKDVAGAAKNVLKDAAAIASETTKEAVKVAQEKKEALKNAAKAMKEDAEDMFEDVLDDAEDLAEDTAEAVEDAVEKLAETAEDAAAPTEKPASTVITEEAE